MIMFQLPKTIISYSSLTQKLFDVISVYLAFVVACAARPARIFTNNVIASSIHIHVRLKQGFYIAGCARWPLFDDAILEYVYARRPVTIRSLKMHGPYGNILYCTIRQNKSLHRACIQRSGYTDGRIDRNESGQIE